MRESASLSVILHLFVILLLIIGLPDVFRKKITPPPFISVEIVDISKVKQTTSKAKPKSPKPVEKKPDLKPDPESETNPQLENIADLIEEAVPEKNPKEKDKKPKDKKEQPKKKDFLSVLNNIEELEKSSDNQLTNEDEKDIKNMLTAGEYDALIKQISANWSPPAGIRGAKNLGTKIKVTLNPDMTIKEAIPERINNNIHRIAVEAGIRTLYKCGPLKIPRDRYPQLKTFIINFDPQNML